MAVTEHDTGDVGGVKANFGELMTSIGPATRGVPVEDVGELFPTAVVQRELTVGSFEHPEVDREINELDVVLGRGVADEVAIGHKRAEWHADKATALQQPRG